MEFQHSTPGWLAPGTEPPESLKVSGFQAGYKPPAEYFNWLWHVTSNCVAELQNVMGSRTGQLPIVAVKSENGVDYTASVGEIEELVAGFAMIIVPNMGSTNADITLNVNGLGAKHVRLPVSTDTESAAVPNSPTFYAALKPVLVMYDGVYWKVWVSKPSAQDFDGVMPIEHGGTGAGELVDVKTNLQIPTMRDWAEEPKKPGYSAEEISIPEPSQEPLEGDDVLEVLENLRIDIEMIYNMLNASGSGHSWKKYKTTQTLKSGKYTGEETLASSNQNFNPAKVTFTAFTEYTISADGTYFVPAGTITYYEVIADNDESDLAAVNAGLMGKYFVHSADDYINGSAYGKMYYCASYSSENLSHTGLVHAPVTSQQPTTKVYLDSNYLKYVTEYTVTTVTTLLDILTTDTADAYQEGVMYD